MSKRNGARDGMSFPFHYVTGGALVAGVAGILAYPSSFPRVLAEADAWAQFRVRQLRFRLLPSATTTTPLGLQAAGYVPGIQDTQPASVNQVVELVNSCARGTSQDVPTNWVTVGRADLAGPLPWYKSIPGAADATEEAPGSIFIGGTGTEPYLIEIAGVFEFKGGVNTANTPVALAAASALREERVRLAREAAKSRILGVITTVSPKNAIPSERMVGF